MFENIKVPEKRLVDGISAAEPPSVHQTLESFMRRASDTNNGLC